MNVLFFCITENIRSRDSLRLAWLVIFFLCAPLTGAQVWHWQGLQPQHIHPLPQLPLRRARHLRERQRRLRAPAADRRQVRPQQHPQRRRARAAEGAR